MEFVHQSLQVINTHLRQKSNRLRKQVKCMLVKLNI